MFLLLWPLVIEQFLAMAMGAADTVMVSSVGEFAVSGVNIIDNINNLFVIAFTALSTGGAVVCSQYIGRQDSANASLAAKQLIYVVTFISLGIALVAVVFRQPVIRVIYGKLDNDVMNAAARYFLITALSYPMLAIYNGCAALFRSAGNSQVPMRIALLVNIMNIGGNAVFIFVFRLGVAGAALSTLLSRIVAAAILLVMLTTNRRFPASLAGIIKIKLIPSMIRRIMNVGVPTGLENSLFQFGRLLTQRIFPVFGTSVIAANAVTSVINSFSFMLGNAYSLALLTVVGQCIGAGDYEAAKKHAGKILKIAWITVFSVSSIVFVFRSPMVGFFKLSTEAKAAARTFLGIHCVSIALGWTFSFALPAALRAAGDARYVMVVGVISMWIVRVSTAYFLVFTIGLGPSGVWLAMGGDFLVRGICFFVRWRGGKWQKNKVIDAP